MRTEFHEYLDSIAVARNVFAHNLGIVRDRDCRGGVTFTLKWRGWDMAFGEHVVSGPFPEPLQMEEAATVTIQPAERRREFGVGQLIQISAHDLSEMCMNFLQAAQQIESATADHLRHLGFPVTVGDANAPPAPDATTEGVADEVDSNSGTAGDASPAKSP